jgi:cytochrome c551/c552
MTKKHCTSSITLLFVFLLFFATAVSATENNGKVLFTKMDCSVCHAQHEDQKNGPSLQHIASVYGFGGENTLFLRR